MPCDRRLRKYLRGIVLACAAGFVCLGTGAVAAGRPVTHTVVIDGLKFQPESLKVRRGDTVVWVNKDPFPHTATAAGVFDSHNIAAGHSWKYSATKKGEFTYVCTLHSTMRAILRVE